MAHFWERELCIFLTISNTLFNLIPCSVLNVSEKETANKKLNTAGGGQAE